MTAFDLIIVDAGVDVTTLRRSLGSAIDDGAELVLLDEVPGLPVTGEHSRRAFEVSLNGGELATAAISAANRLAFAMVRAIEQSPAGDRLLGYEGIPIRSLLYNVLADDLFASLRLLAVVRHLLEHRRAEGVAFVSPSPTNLALFRAAAPNGHAVRTSARVVPSLVATARPIARFVRDLTVRGRRRADHAWSLGDPGAPKILFAGNAVACEDKHPNSFHALMAAGLGVAVLCYAGRQGALPIPHFVLNDATVSRRRQLSRWRHWLRFRCHRRAIARQLATIPVEPALGDLVPRLCETALHRLLDRGLYVALDLLDVLEASVVRLRPDLLLFDNRHLFGLCAALAARKCGVPSVWAQDGVVGSEEPGKMAMEADVCATWGHATDRYLKGTGIDASRVTAVGAPFMDDLAKRTFLDRSALGGALGLSLEDGDRIVSYMSVYVSLEALGPFAFGGNPAQHKAAVVEEICRTVLAIPDAKLIVKRHPADPDQDFDRAVVSRLLPADRFAVTTRPDLFYDILKHSDLVILHDGSTTGVEAAALGRPTLGVDFNNIDGAGTNSWVREGIAIPVRTADEMLPAARAALFDTGVRSALADRRTLFMREWVHASDGRNCERLVETVVAAMRRRW